MIARVRVRVHVRVHVRVRHVEMIPPVRKRVCVKPWVHINGRPGD